MTIGSGIAYAAFWVSGASVLVTLLVCIILEAKWKK